MKKAKFRFLNQDGTTNVRKKRSLTDVSDLYHRFMSASHFEFILAIAAIYVLINLIFGTIYFLIGPSQLAGLRFQQGVEFFIECFFFSVQTFSTIGYGHISPLGLIDNSIVAVEALTGLLSIAIMSGVFFCTFFKSDSSSSFFEYCFNHAVSGAKGFYVPNG